MDVDHVPIVSVCCVLQTTTFVLYVEPGLRSMGAHAKPVPTIVGPAQIARVAATAVLTVFT